jgi:hypothetical protein
MAQELEKHVVEITRRPSNNPSMLASGFVALCAVVGIGISLNAGHAAAVFLFTATALGAGAFVFFSLRFATTSNSGNVLNWRAAAPELQQQSVCVEVAEIARTFEVDPSQTAELYQAYIVAQDLALRQVQEEQNAPLLRHVQAGRTSFDALVIKPGSIICVEVAFLVTPFLRQDKIEASMKKAATLRRFLKAEGIDSRVNLMLVLVTQLTPKDEKYLMSTLSKEKNRFDLVDDEFTEPFNNDHLVELVRFDFQELQRRYLGEV